ncbi:MAG: haloalkane dehalogenase [Pseudomonadales bacterium]
MKRYSRAAKVIATTLFLLFLNGCSDDDNDELFTALQSAEVCEQPEDDVAVQTADDNVAFVRTPDSCFAELDDFDYSPNYVALDGLRMHYVDAGPADGEVVLMLHGQPSWSYLYRKMIPVLVDAGYRVIAVDHIGMGRSDKPVDPQVHQYEQHVEWIGNFIDELGLSDINLFVQDWGSLIGLRVAGDRPDLFARIIVANGDMPVIPAGFNPFAVPTFEVDDTQNISAQEFFTSRSPERIAGFQQWIDYTAGNPNLIAAEVIEIATLGTLRDEEFASYNTPFPSFIYKAAIRAFPSMVAGIEEQNSPAWDALGKFEKPFLFLAGELDPNLGSLANQEKWIEHVPGARGQRHKRYTAGHFIQDDVGAELASDVASFIQNGNQILANLPTPGFLYNFRYCEVLATTELASGQFQAVVWNSIPAACPQSDWEALDAAAIATDLGVDQAFLNGPRYWVLDTIANNAVNSGPRMTEEFGGIPMFRAATVLLAEGVEEGESAYQINTVSRDTVFTYIAGREVYELQNPSGERFIMQSFTRRLDPDLLLSDLAFLDERLDLPTGWKFVTRTLDAQFDLSTVNGIAEVVADDLGNVYQRIP